MHVILSLKPIYTYTFTKQQFCLSTESDEILCYLHAVSPIKKAMSSNKRYFNCMLQKNDTVIRAVCFSPQKHSELKTLQQTKSPVKVSNYQKSQNKDIILNQYTKIAPVDPTDINFMHSNKLTSTGTAKTISSLNELAPEQVVTLKAEVAQVSSVKKIHTQYQGALKKQEVLLRDSTSSIKAILWECSVDALKANKTYILKNLKLKTSRCQRYLNTAKDEEFLATETTPFDQPLVEIDNVDLTSTTMSAKVIGLQELTSTMSCIACKKTVTPCTDDDLLGECETCNLIQILDACSTQWYMHLLLQNTTNPTEKRRLVFYNQEVKQLLDILKLSLDLNTSTERAITFAILRANKQIKITYDSMTNKVTDIASL